MTRTLIVLPTYNEYDNIRLLLPQLAHELNDVEFLVVDDASPDGTALAVRELQGSISRLHLLERERKEGLGRAYVAGFNWALQHKYDVVVQMDADFSHRIVDLKNLLQKFRLPSPSPLDFVVGSRWMTGGKIWHWHWSRWLLSWAGNFYVQCILGNKIKDWTGGFNIWRAVVLSRLDLPHLEAQGYAFQIELKYRALRLNFKGIEVPIIFEERTHGQSKMSVQIIVEALTCVWHLKSKF